MPDRVVRKTLELIGKHTSLVVFVLTVTMLIAAIFAALGWNEAREAQRRLTSVEQQQRDEATGKDIADVTTCFNQSYTTPTLIVILRGIAVKLDSDPRDATLALIDQMDNDSPTLQDCRMLARRLGIDPSPYIRNPSARAGERGTP
jgi:hypothetical protein